MSTELELSVVSAGRPDLGYLSGFAVTDQVILTLGGLASEPTVLASSNAREFETRKSPKGMGLRDVLAVADQVSTCGEYGQLAASPYHGATWRTFASDTDACLFGLALGNDGAV